MNKKPSPLRGLENLPPTSDAHELADYIEIICLLRKDGRISKPEVLAFVRQRVRDLSEGKTIEIEEIEDEDLADDQGLTESDGEPALINDKWEQRAVDWFKHFEYRVGVFGEYYPFKTLKGGTVLVLKRSKLALTLKQKLYIFFLFASSLRLFTKSASTSIASTFELFSYYALKAYLPQATEVHMFGKHALNNGRYTGGLWGKLSKLADDISERVVCEKTNFHPINSGDAGLDVVGWLPLEEKEKARGFLLAFGQCACTRAWVKKQQETHYDVWQNYISFTAYPFRLTFIPFCFRTAKGDWYEWTKIQMNVLVDRLRMLRLLEGAQNKLKAHIILHVDDVLHNAKSVI